MDVRPSYNPGTAAYRLFRYHYLFNLPSSAKYTTSDYEYFGLPTTGDNKVDAALASVMTPHSISVAEAAHFYANGFPVAITDPKDSVKIYTDINDHLKCWRDYLQKVVAPRKPPIQGLVEFDRLAGTILPIARRNGLVPHLKRDKRYSTNRSFGGDVTDVDMNKVVHSSTLLNQILYLAKQHGYRTTKYDTAEASPFTGRGSV